MDTTLSPEVPPRNLKRYAGIYAALWKNSVVREMGFRTNFVLWIFVELLWFSLNIAFIAVIYQHTSHIGSWTKWQVVMLVGASHFIQQLFQAFFLTNCLQISEYIRLGKLDFMLLLPINTRFILSLRQVDLGGFVNASSGLAVMAYCVHKLEMQLHVVHVLSFFTLTVVGVFIHYALMFMLTSVSFWTIRAQGVVWGYYSLFHIARMPDVVFRGFMRVCFTFVLPMLLVSNVPVKILVQKLKSPWEVVLLLVMSIVCLAISEVVWRVSLRHYRSASS